MWVRQRKLTCWWVRLRELIRRILRWLAHRRGSPAHQRHLIRFLRRGPGASCSLHLGGHRHPSEHAIYSQHSTRKRTGRPGRVDRITIPSHAASPPWAGTRRSAAQHPTRCHCSAVVQGVRVRGRRHKGCCYEGAGEAELSVLAPSGAFPI